MKHQYRIRKVNRRYWAEYLRPAIKFFGITIAPKWKTIDWWYGEESARATIREHIEMTMEDPEVIINYP